MSVIILGDTLVGSNAMGGVIPDVTNVTPDAAWYVSRWFVVSDASTVAVELSV